MTARTLLGSADVSEETLAVMVADLLGHDTVELVESTVRCVDYDVPSLTTRGRYWVSGIARTPAGDAPYRLFVKHVQAVQHAPFFELIPAPFQKLFAASYPWQVEAAVYRSDLARRLPRGLSMPRALGVFDTEADSAVIWIEPVPARAAVWDVPRYERAAYLLGRLSASPSVRELGDVGGFEWNVMDYVALRMQGDVIPRVESEETWAHPQVAASFGAALRDRMRGACAQADAYGRELLTMPHLASHGDASPNNLLAGSGADEFVLIDFGHWLSKPLGHDLGQLIAGEVQLGRVPPAALPTLDEHCVAAYARGLADEGLDIDLEVVRRAHALQLFLFNGASALPEGDMSPDHVAARALLARHSLDLLEQTG